MAILRIVICASVIKAIVPGITPNQDRTSVRIANEDASIKHVEKLGINSKGFPEK